MLGGASGDLGSGVVKLWGGTVAGEGAQAVLGAGARRVVTLGLWVGGAASAAVDKASNKLKYVVFMTSSSQNRLRDFNHAASCITDARLRWVLVPCIGAQFRA